ncbi:hypothetical protein [Roseospira goensis]|uniref:Uncharacterized protein n=1 Tax=Roseospira goensis TaxID=391922 RepID=A0A7W6RW95_9PROT|nr:hypothetical protein [Roseospira goensis]MBB4284408.1 hypothetical protein [Roseospira goensis]
MPGIESRHAGRAGAVTAAAIAVLALGLLWGAAALTPARAEGAWTLTYDLDPADGMNCSMETYWDDGSEFHIFANANDFVGFYITDPAWVLEQGQESWVSFRFGGRDFSFPVSAVDRSAVVGDLSSNESGALAFLERWARSWEMAIVFPQGATWPVNLNGTMATFRQWVDCYDDLERIAARSGGGGGGGANPFGGGRGGAKPSANPF